MFQVTTKPEFQHDCDACFFLAHYRDHDLYICGEGEHASILARYSNDGPDYRSHEAGMLAQSIKSGFIHWREPIAVAHLLAEIIGKVPSCG